MNELRIVSRDKILRFENTLIIIKNGMLCFVLINSVLLNLLCVWIKQIKQQQNFCCNSVFPLAVNDWKIFTRTLQCTDTLSAPLALPLPTSLCEKVRAAF